MRPNKFASEVTKAVVHRYRTGSNSLFTPYLIRRMEREYKKWSVEEGDYRAGEETYGYDNDDDQINGNLMYISDRWRCAFRLKWLLDGLEKGVI